MLAYTYPILGIFWTMLEFFLFFVWIWLLIVVFSDIFRSHDMGGLAKALWVIFVIIIPYLGVLIYLIARGGSMHERAAAQAAQQQKAFDAYVKQAAGTSGSSSVDELAKLADLKSKGVITDAEFEAQKAKLLSLSGFRRPVSARTEPQTDRPTAAPRCEMHVGRPLPFPGGSGSPLPC